MLRLQYVLLIFLIFGCGAKKSTSLSWYFDFANSDLRARARTVDITIAEGSCGSATYAYSTTVTLGSGESPAVPKSLPPGQYAFSGRARDARCLWFATGCQEITLPSTSEKELHIALEPSTDEAAPGCSVTITPEDGGIVPPPTCIESQCEGKRCTGSPLACDYYTSCRQMHAADPNAAVFPTGQYVIDPDGIAGVSAKSGVYCEMTADGGGWTLALKLEGTNINWVYESTQWTTNTVFGETSLDLSATEAKFASFSTMPFSELRVGMSKGGVTRFTNFAVNGVNGKSLREIFASNIFYPVTVGRSTWLGLVNGATLQMNCNREGLNNSILNQGLPPTVLEGTLGIRIGILGNGYNVMDCHAVNSWVGFGGNHESVCFNPVISTVGSIEECKTPYTDVSAFGYIFIR